MERRWRLYIPKQIWDIFIQYEKKFSGYDSILDKLHEDLNRISDKQYIKIKGKRVMKLNYKPLQDGGIFI